MRNYVQPGNIVTVAAPAGGAVNGRVVAIGALVGVASANAASGQPVDLQMRGVFDLAAAVGATFNVGDVAYSNGDTITATNTQTRVGVVVGNPSSQVYRVRLGN